jgi:F-type H+-transporting ATPase subunit epsilon
MAKIIHIEIVTPRKVLFNGDVENFTAPGAMGPFQVLYNHAPIIAALVPGVFTYVEQGGKEEHFAISGGFLELHKNSGTLLADAVEALPEIDLDRAERAMARAKERLKGYDEAIDRERAKRSLDRAEARVKAAKFR